MNATQACFSDSYSKCISNKDCCEGFSCDYSNTQRCYPVPRQIFQPCSHYAECGDYLSCHTISGLNRCYHYPRMGGEPCSNTDMKAQCMIGLICHQDYQICVQTEILNVLPL
eukprot:403364124